VKEVKRKKLKGKRTRKRESDDEPEIRGKVEGKK
jgi:hypothetical protein